MSYISINLHKYQFEHAPFRKFGFIIFNILDSFPLSKHAIFQALIIWSSIFVPSSLKFNTRKWWFSSARLLHPRRKWKHHFLRKWHNWYLVFGTYLDEEHGWRWVQCSGVGWNSCTICVVFQVYLTKIDLNDSNRNDSLDETRLIMEISCTDETHQESCPPISPSHLLRRKVSAKDFVELWNAILLHSFVSILTDWMTEILMLRWKHKSEGKWCASDSGGSFNCIVEKLDFRGRNLGSTFAPCEVLFRYVTLALRCISRASGRGQCWCCIIGVSWHGSDAFKMSLLEIVETCHFCCLKAESRKMLCLKITHWRFHWFDKSSIFDVMCLTPKKDFKKAKSSWPWALHSSYGMGGSRNLWVTFIQTCDFHFQRKGSEQIRREVERCCVQHSEILAKVLRRSCNLENLHEASAALDPLVWWNSGAAPSCTDSSSGAPSFWDIGRIFYRNCSNFDVWILFKYLQ